MTKHIVHTVKVEQQMIIKIAVQRKESDQGSPDHASLVHRGGGVKETKQLAKHTESPERQPVVLHRQNSTVQAVQKNRVELSSCKTSTKLLTAP